MKRIDFIKDMTAEEFGRFMCDKMEDSYEFSCDMCPVYADCWNGHNGWVAWFEKNVTEGEEDWLFLKRRKQDEKPY